MILANKILETIDKHSVYENRIYKSKTSKFDGKVVECDSFPSPIGTICEIECNDSSKVTGEIIGFKEKKNIIAVHQQNANIILGSSIKVLNSSNDVEVGFNLLGRVIDAFGKPIDGTLEQILPDEMWPINGKPINPMTRKPINEVLDVGIRAINSLFTVGRGQRLGIIAGSGVGKSILLGMMTKFTDADIVVVALIGERGRELGNFVSEILNDESKKRTVIVAVPADNSPLLRIKGAERATSIAEYFRSKGKNVLLIMDSLTRIAHAKREVGLALGEQPTSKGYPPSVISMIPNLIERTGSGKENEGTITSFYTILADSDDTNDPVVDTARAILDGHIVLSRELAQLGIFPAIDLNQSLSRIMNAIVSEDQQRKSEFVKKLYSIYQENKELVLMGGYSQGQNAEIDSALNNWPKICELIKQNFKTKSSFNDSLNSLKKIN
jgi:flagellum-specific ATP synthase